jgi:DNA-binding MarR family transcriptional regulator
MENKILASSLRTVISKINKRLRKQAHSADSLSISECTTLSYLNLNESFSSTELANLLKVKGQSMSEIITRLQERDIVQKTPSLIDKRKSLISLTPYGRQIVVQFRYERDEWLTNAIEHELSAKEIQVLKEAIELMNRISDFK